MTMYCRPQTMHLCGPRPLSHSAAMDVAVVGAAGAGEGFALFAGSAAERTASASASGLEGPASMKLRPRVRSNGPSRVTDHPLPKFTTETVHASWPVRSASPALTPDSMTARSSLEHPAQRIFRGIWNGSPERMATATPRRPGHPPPARLAQRQERKPAHATAMCAGLHRLLPAAKALRHGPSEARPPIEDRPSMERVVHARLG